MKHVASGKEVWGVGDGDKIYKRNNRKHTLLSLEITVASDYMERECKIFSLLSSFQ